MLRLAAPRPLDTVPKASFCPSERPRSALEACGCPLMAERGCCALVRRSVCRPHASMCVEASSSTHRRGLRRLTTSVGGRAPQCVRSVMQGSSYQTERMVISAGQCDGRSSSAPVLWGECWPSCKAHPIFVFDPVSLTSQTPTSSKAFRLCEQHRCEFTCCRRRRYSEGVRMVWEASPLRLLLVDGI